jgi:hypothetical protein
MGEKRNAHRFLVRRLKGIYIKMHGTVNVKNLKGMRPLVRHRRRSEDNIKVDIKGVIMKSMDWIHLVDDRYKWRAVVSTVMNIGFS